MASLYSELSRVKKSSSFQERVSNVGLFMGSLCQHSIMISYRVLGQPGGEGMRYPCSTWCSTSALVIPVHRGQGYNSYQLQNTSHSDYLLISKLQRFITWYKWLKFLAHGCYNDESCSLNCVQRNRSELF